MWLFLQIRTNPLAHLVVCSIVEVEVKCTQSKIFKMERNTSELEGRGKKSADYVGSDFSLDVYESSFLILKA